MSIQSRAQEPAGSQIDWLRRDQRYAVQSPYAPPLVFDRGRGCALWDVDGRRYLDFESGQFCMSTGHSHPLVTAAIRGQAETLMQIGNRFTNRPRILLAERLAALCPPPLDAVLFCSTGSEANETALRLAKLVTGRYEVVALARGYHGRTNAAFSASSSARRMRRGSGPTVPGTLLVDAPYSYRCPFQCGSCTTACWSHSKEMIDRATSGEPAAVIMELVIGAGGIIPVPANWARAVREFCDDRGSILIADEALTGLGRTGKWFAFQHYDIVPDIVVISKALGGGVPAAAVITSRKIADQAISRGFIQAASHQGDPLQCAVALANIDIIEKEGLLENAQRMGQRLMEHLQALVERHVVAGQARGIGLIAGLEIIQDEIEAPALAAEVSVKCMNKGLILGGLRPGIREGNTLRLAPPLTVTEVEIDRAVEILDAALTEVESG